MTGTTLLHYRIAGKLGKGGMGEVFAAEDTKLQRRVALKLLPSEVASDPERLQRFQREARAIAALNHPNVVTIYSVEETGGIQFLTMELVEGKTLGEIIPPDGLPLEELLKLALPLVDAVAAAHEHGIVHRDLKPANVMLASDGRLKVLDFGLAKLKPGTSDSSASTTTRLATESLTTPHAIVGTAAYMSPEQAEGRPVDHRTDIFSLGVVLYEMACGRRPFEGDTVFSLISSIIKDTPRPLSDVRRDIPMLLDRIVTRALAKDPAERYQSAAELRNALQEVQQQTAAGRLVRGIVWSITRSGWTLRVALAAAVLVIAASSAWYLWVGRDAADARAQAAPLSFRTKRLTASVGVAQFPSLTPDGKWVVYAGEEAGNRDIYLLSTSGQNPRNLTADSPADDDEPAASPDGERIAFRSSREAGGIFVMGLTGEGVRRVTPVGVGAAFNPAWSPDGTEIAYTTENVQLTPLNWERQSELWAVNVSTGAQRRLAVRDAVQAAWSPHGYRIAYASRVEVGSSGRPATGATGSRVMDIYTIPAGGGEPVAATDDPPTDWSPVWAPDGRHLYFVSDRGGSMNLWRVAIDERSGKPLGQPEAITTPAPFLAHPTISGDGRRIAYSAVSKTINIQQVTLNPATGEPKGEPTAMTTGSRLWANPDPSPDGEWVVFYSQDQPEGDIYLMRRDRTGLRQLTRDDEVQVVDRVPRWSPDNTWVAFFSNRNGKIAVWKIRAADGSDLRQVTPTGGVPVWSPDGQRLATNVLKDFASDAFVFDANRLADEQKPEMLARPDKALQPFIPNDWSPDGSRLAGMISFSDRGGNGIVVYTFATRSYERLTDYGEWPAWFGGNQRVFFVNRGKEFWVYDLWTKQARKVYSTTWDVLGPPRLTRDGRSVFFSRRVTEGDVYLLTFE